MRGAASTGRPIPGNNSPLLAQSPLAALLRVLSRRVVFIPILLLIPLIILPLIFLVIGAFQSAPPGQNGTWTLANLQILWSTEFVSLAVNSLILAVLTTAVSICLGFVLAVATTRLGVPLPRLFDAAAITPAYIPAFVGAIAWSFLLSPQSGYLNTIPKLIGLPPLNIFSWWGMVFVLSLYNTPIAYLYLRPALASVDRSLEEAASVLGAGRIRTIWRILLPLVRPALLSSALVVFIHALGDFAVVEVLGTQINVNVIALRIVQLSTVGPVDPGEAAVLGVVLAVASTLGLRVILRSQMGSADYVTVGTRRSGGNARSSGMYRSLSLILCIVYSVFAVVLPVLVLLVGSFQPYLSANLSSGWTFNNYVELASGASFVTSIVNSLILSVGAAVVCGLLAMALAYYAVRRRGVLATIVNYISTIPLAVPPMVFAVALIWMWSGLPVGPYGTRWILLLAYVGMLIPYAFRTATTAVQQLDPVLEEAGRMSGSNGWRIAARITAPLLVPGVVAGATVVLYHAMQELSASIIIYPPGQPVLPVTIWGLVFNGEYAQLFTLSAIYVLMILVLVGLVSWVGRRFGRI